MLAFVETRGKRFEYYWFYMKKDKEKTRKGLKITVLLWALVILSGVYIGMSFFPQAVSAEVPDDPTAGIDTPIDEVVENPVVNDNQGDYEMETAIPTDPIALINYALNIYNNGKGSQSTVAYSIQNKGEFGGLSVSLNQYCQGNILRCGNQSLEESYLYYKESEIPSVLKGINNQHKLVSNYYRAVNVDHDTNQVNYVQTTSYDRVNQTYDLTKGDRAMETYSIEEANDRFITIYSEAFPLEISYNTVRITAYNTRKDSTYNYVSVSYNVNKLPEKLKLYYFNNAQLGYVDYQEYNYTFVINKKTGKLRRMIREEEFTSPGLNGAITVTSKVRFQQDFQKMDTPVEVRKPYLEHVAP